MAFSDPRTLEQGFQVPSQGPSLNPLDLLGAIASGGFGAYNNFQQLQKILSLAGWGGGAAASALAGNTVGPLGDMLGSLASALARGAQPQPEVLSGIDKSAAAANGDVLPSATAPEAETSSETTAEPGEETGGSSGQPEPGVSKLLPSGQGAPPNPTASGDSVPNGTGQASFPGAPARSTDMSPEALRDLSIFGDVLNPRHAVTQNLRALGVNPISANPSTKLFQRHAEDFQLPVLAQIAANPDLVTEAPTLFRNALQGGGVYSPRNAVGSVFDIARGAQNAAQLLNSGTVTDPDQLSRLAVVASLGDSGLISQLLSNALGSGLPSDVARLIQPVASQLPLAAEFNMSRSGPMLGQAQQNRSILDYLVPGALDNLFK